MAKSKKINGKPIEHWEKTAHDLLMRILVEEAYNYHNSSSVVHRILHERLKNLANAIDPRAVDRLLEERATCQKNLGCLILSFSSGKKKKSTRARRVQ